MPVPRLASKTRHSIFIIFLSALFLGALHLTGSAVVFAQDRHLLWSVDAGEGRVTLMGSIHTLRPEDYPLPSAYERAYNDATVIVFETDISRMNDQAIQERLLSLGLYPEGETLRDHLSSDAYDALATVLRDRGLSPEQFARFKPWFCAFSLTLLELQRLGFSPLHGLDMHFFTRAGQDGKEMFHLESAETQIEHVASLGHSEQESFLLQSLQDLEVLASKAAGMTEAWRNGDAGGLDDIIQMGFKGFPEIYDRLITRRNRDWLPRVEDLIKGGRNVLVIVGAGHLVGDDSLVRMLEDRGYRLEQE
ncbi:MAG: TraB/GumN family protein [Desulfatiglandales bacterium]